MYCEKCGKQNDEGAIFCSNCSSVLRSRRQSSQPAEGETKRFKLPEEVAEVAPVSQPAKPVVNDMPAAPVAVREKAAKSGFEFEEEEPVRRAPKKRPEPKYVHEEYEEYDEYSPKTGSAWFGILAVVSWLSFVAMAAVGIVGGVYLVFMGLGGENPLLTYSGIAGAIVFVVIGLTILSKNMVKIKIARTLNEIKFKK